MFNITSKICKKEGKFEEVEEVYNVDRHYTCPNGHKLTLIASAIMI